ncbi:enoyl-CoA hydratase-related protein [Nocardioides perillae]|uniref:Enoyl-CoA hydratase/methylglutaconyl-CoA hydratase n=1 Tax=Nocardioides perillae TaxID=1119534 RepID=A0A7Y9RRR4_9ACTN|nr:enoyl-CoA hydratase/methylglutaconyl-CoA hydratase [Nocardioides perillae]
MTDSTAPEAELVRYEVGGPDGLPGTVATVTLDSPHNRNALSRRLLTGLREALERAEADPAVRVVVLRSSGRVFCSGADMSEAREGGMEEGTRAIVDLQRRIVSSTKAVVVVLGGPVRAGGIGLVAAADVVLAAEDATLALTEVKLGLAPAVISLTVLPRMTSRGAALAALGGEVFDAAQAERWGLVTRAVPGERLEEEATALVASLATGAPQGIRETKALLARDLLARLEAQADDVAATSARLFGSEEAREAMAAFLSRDR